MCALRPCNVVQEVCYEAGYGRQMQSVRRIVWSVKAAGVTKTYVTIIHSNATQCTGSAQLRRRRASWPDQDCRLPQAQQQQWQQQLQLQHANTHDTSIHAASGRSLVPTALAVTKVCRYQKPPACFTCLPCEHAVLYPLACCPHFCCRRLIWSFANAHIVYMTKSSQSRKRSALHTQERKEVVVHC